MSNKEEFSLSLENMKTRNTRSADDAIRTPKSSTTREKVDIYSSLHHLQHKSTFGSTIKIEKGISSLSPSKPDKFNHLDRVDNWFQYNHLQQLQPRPKIAATFSKLLVSPGPADYDNNNESLNYLSSVEHSQHNSLYSRVNYSPVDVLLTPGPGSYEFQSGIEAGKGKVIPKWQEPPKRVTRDKHNANIGPASYDFSEPALQFHTPHYNKTPKVLLPVPSSTQKRSVLDKRNGNIYEEYGGSKVVVEKKDMGPGKYYDKLLHAEKAIGRKLVVHTIGQRLPVEPAKGDFCGPSPGSYDPDRALFGALPLKEGGGVSTLPDKPCNTSDASGSIKGHHAHYSFCTPHFKDMKRASKIVVTSISEVYAKDGVNTTNTTNRTTRTNATNNNGNNANSGDSSSSHHGNGVPVKVLSGKWVSKNKFSTSTLHSNIPTLKQTSSFPYQYNSPPVGKRSTGRVAKEDRVGGVIQSYDALKSTGKYMRS